MRSERANIKRYFKDRLYIGVQTGQKDSRGAWKEITSAKVFRGKPDLGSWGDEVYEYTPEKWDVLRHRIRSEASRLGREFAERIFSEGQPLLTSYPIWTHTRKNPESLYSSFHGANPTRVRQISFEPPKPGEKLVAIGRVTQINYRPYGSSRRKGTEFFHKMGDTGEHVNPEKPILAVSQDGKRFYLIRDESKMHFSERGIIS